MTLKIISAEDVLFEGEVSSVTLPGAMGSFTGDGGETTTVHVDGGIVDVDNNIVSVCIY